MQITQVHKVQLALVFEFTFVFLETELIRGATFSCKFQFAINISRFLWKMTSNFVTRR